MLDIENILIFYPSIGMEDLTLTKQCWSPQAYIASYFEEEKAML